MENTVVKKKKGLMAVKVLTARTKTTSKGKEVTEFMAKRLYDGEIIKCACIGKCEIQPGKNAVMKAFYSNAYDKYIAEYVVHNSPAPDFPR